MSSVHDHPHSDCKSTSLLNQSCLCVFHGGASLHFFEDGTTYNTLRFEFFVDAACCKASPQSLFSVAVRQKEHLTAVVQSCAYPVADGCARLTLRLCEQSFSTNFACGAWVAVVLRITHSGAACSSCSQSSRTAASQFTLSVTFGDASFTVSNDFPQNHFRGALQLGSRAPETATQPAVFRCIFAEAWAQLCPQCSLTQPAPLSRMIQPCFSAPLPLRCNPLELEGSSSCSRLYTQRHSLQSFWPAHCLLCLGLGQADRSATHQVPSIQHVFFAQPTSAFQRTI
jgi:hypothetical protein